MTDRLYTIGYEGSSIEDFLTTLTAAGVTSLIDVRDVPLSRKRGFSKRALAEHLEAAGISYVHLKGLGDPKPGRVAAREGRYDDFRRIFSEHLLTGAAKVDLARAVDLAGSETSCLMCFERDHRGCHRAMVAAGLSELRRIDIVHLGVNPHVRVTSRGSQRHVGAVPICG